MQNLLNDIYSIDNIITYIIMAIVALVILFVIILIFGKKDQKLEETKRLELMNKNLDDKKDEDAFKQENVEGVKLEKEQIHEKYPDILLPSSNQSEKENTDVIKEVQPLQEKIEKDEESTISIPFEKLNETPILKKKEEIPLIINKEQEIPKIDEKREIEIVEEPISVELKEFTPPKEVMPVKNINIIDKDEESDSIQLDSFETKKEDLQMPEIKLDDIKIKTEEKPIEIIEDKIHYERPNTGYEGTLPRPQIFSSVYVEKKEEKPEVIEIVGKDESDDDLDFELPQLKSEPKKDNQTFSFESLTGEKYNINK